MIDKALPSLRAWTDAFSRVEIPVLPGSVAELNQLRMIEETKGTVDAHTLADGLANDPLMTLKVLVHVSRYCTRLSVEPPETLVGAIVMQGITPFFRAFKDTTTILEWLHEQPDALSGLIKVITRARRAAHFAMGFALRRQDEDATVIQEAALLHDFTEMLLWCHAPKLALEIATRQKADYTIRSADIQREVLGIELGDLSQELMRLWQLPYLLIKCTDDHNAADPKIRNVMLGVRIARHTQYGWDDPHAQAALPDDVGEVARLLNLSHDAAYRLVQGMDN
ncbi:MAG TPA: HDOD domain-containing protein [Aquabacterium sp.]|uniref:HDOD domain-containing protein n=1 Tax=Aquabacterium sp. TaxID=1872578 RepID=UPI002E2F6CF6|nr:HDOD domain-containing protein [Aquabacterium sp.]HEX5357576.1 HDOD domain-containing protein [Aquabacterium sp.]